MNIEIWKRFIYKRDELFKNADAKFTQARKLVRELIHEDNTSLSFHSEIEKSITKATSEEKITATRELDITTQRDYKNTPPENDSKITMKEKSKKRKFKVPYKKKEEQKYSDQIPHRREFPSQAEMVDATGQKTSMRDSSVLTVDEQKSSADIPITNTIPTSIIIKNTKESNRSNTWRTGRLS